MKEQLLSIVRPFGQEHLLRFWDELDAAQRAELADEVRGIDFALIDRLYRAGAEDVDFSALARRAEPPPAVRLNADDNPFDQTAAKHAGGKALAAGTVGAALVAGGQGSRLGFDYPKGMFPIGPVSNASLFQIHIEKIRAVARRYGVRIPLYLMTSPATDAETRDYLDSYGRFGLDADDLLIFCQGTMPAADARTGELLMTGRHQLFQSPDGHGGMVHALARSGALADMTRRGLKHLFFFQVDNPLATVCDAELIGYHVLARSQYTLQVAAKARPLEKVGNVVSVDGTVRIIEYSDLPDEVAEQRNADGSLKLWAGNLAVHVFDVDFLDEMSRTESALPFHRALKTVPHIDEHGETIDPTEPNAIKFEQFIFDLLPAADRSLTVEADPAVAFAPVKNATGSPVDTPESAQTQMMNLHRSWLRAAGATIDDETRVEISPLFALDAEELAKNIAPSTTITEDTYFGEIQS
jgi:UDP-N-acetylglucosamine/UDP-N-acetylgalactosamine diphosphorylase